MTTIYTSKTVSGFLAGDVFGDRLPADAVELDLSVHAALLQAQAEGKIIQFGDGTPIAIDRPGPTPDQIKAARINAIDGLLTEIDKKRARALSDAVLIGDHSRLQALEDQAAPLRTERATLV